MQPTMLGSDGTKPSMLGKDSTLFSEVAFHIVESRDLTHERTLQLQNILESHGATQRDLSSPDDTESWRGLTHIIASTINFDAYEGAEEHMLAVVKPKWVYDSLAKQKLANPRSYSPDPRLFFSGLQIGIADIPEGDKDAIIGGVLAIGGLYSGSLTKLVTHLVALSTDAQSCQMAIAKGLKCKMVLPHWFNDCLRLGRRIPEGPYLLPNPEVLRLKPHDRVGQILTPEPQAGEPVVSLTESSSRERQGLTVFEGKRVLLSDDLGIGEHLRSTIQTIVDTSKGQVTLGISDADVLICQYRDGPDYEAASARAKTIGSLAWLYHAVTRNTWTSPLRQLLHFPIARDGIPGFKRYRISLSNYSGDARIYLENLARAAGCEFTRTMKQDNTHLITAHPNSEKCDAAREWNVHIVNHIWLEESYAKWQIQSVAEPRYSQFPPRTNLGDVVGLTPVDKDALVAFVQKETGKRPAMGVDNLHVDSGSNEVAEAESTLDTPISSKTPLRPKTLQSIRTKPGETFTPARAPTHTEEKENESPPTTGRRGAKDKAAARLHELAPDIALYEKEKKRVGGGGVVWGGRPTSEEIVQRKKRKLPKRSDRDVERAPNAKRVKVSPKSGSIRLLVTGHERWNKDSKVFQYEKAQLQKLGVVVTPDPMDCTHVAAPKVLRTPKFICAMSRAPVLLHLSFIEACLEENKLAAAEDYQLDDYYAFLNGKDEECSMQASEAVELARENQGNLLQGQQIFVTDGIDGGFDAYKSIIEANGGQACLFKGRQGLSYSTTQDDDDAIEDPAFVYLVSGETTAQEKLCERFEELATGWGKVPRIVKKDWILLTALSQEVQPSIDYAITSAA